MTNHLVPVDQLIQIADRIKSAVGMVPKQYQNQPGAILAAMLMGQDLGIGPMASLRAFHVVEGRPSASSDFWSARMKQAGYTLLWPESGPERCVLEIVDPKGNKHREMWDKKRAQDAGLWGRNTWAKHPESMLRARCITSGGRAFASEVMFGCYSEDEAEEIRDTASRVVETKAKAVLAERLGVPLGEPAKAPDTVPEEKQDGPQPFDLFDEALAAIESCDHEGRLGLVAARLKVSRFSEGETDDLRQAYRDQLDTIREAEAAREDHNIEDNPVA